MSVFLTGTDTGVGKTFMAVALLRLARAAGLRSVGYKPICCGDREDAELLLAASSDGVHIDEVNPLWLKMPAAPLPAAEAEAVEIQAERLLEGFRELRQRFDFVVVEGVGGWLVPIRADYFVSDLAKALALPVIVVALNRLGCLNHTMLTLRSISADQLDCAGVALNSRDTAADVAVGTNRAVLERITAVPILRGLTPETPELPPGWRGALGIRPDTR